VLETDTGFAKGYGSKIKGESAFQKFISIYRN